MTLASERPLSNPFTYTKSHQTQVLAWTDQIKNTQWGQFNLNLTIT